MAIDSFHTHITSAGTPGQDLVLKLGMKSLSGEITWSLLRPEQWTDIVRDGDEIRLGDGSVPDISDLHGPSPIITLMGPKIDPHTKTKNSKFVTTLLPKTCEVSWLN